MTQTFKMDFQDLVHYLIVLKINFFFLYTNRSLQMSTMLEKAIVDAAALKEAALKNAEATIIEKYAPQIKDAVAALLEQEEEDLGLEEDPLADPLAMGDELGGEAEAPEAAVPDVPRADAGGEKLCPCPDDEDVVEVDFDQLVADMEEGPMGAPGSQEELAGAMPALQEEVDLSEEALKDIIDEEVELSEDLLASVVEALTVDMNVVPDAPNAAAQYTPEDTKDHADELAAAIETEDEDEDEQYSPETHLHELNELKQIVTSLQEDKDRLKSTILQMKDLLEEANLSNAKLLYTNRVFTSTSLNERQRNKFVEAIDSAVSVEEAKVIYETLQSTVGESTRKKTPQSLSEVVKRGSSTVLPRRNSKANNSTDDNTKIRWARLAGIK